METTSTVYSCDLCKKPLPTSNNAVHIQTEVKPNPYFERIRINIEHISGMSNSNNPPKHRDVDLCQRCTYELLTQAVTRVSKGERITKGIQSSKEEIFT